MKEGGLQFSAAEAMKGNEYLGMAEVQTVVTESGFDACVCV